MTRYGGNRIRTYDLKVMSLASYQTALSRDKIVSAHCRIRTDDICFTRAMLWPTELSRLE